MLIARHAVVAGVVAASLVACGDAAAAGFTFSSRALGPTLRERVTGTCRHPGCPVGLRYLRVAFWGFDGRRHVGELVAATSAVGDLHEAFAELYRVRFPIRRMRLVDVYPDGTTVHRASRPYLNRARHRRGMAFAGGALVRAFAAAGWGWGGAWRPPSATDYQHFSATGR